ncbi:hypothetical protein BDA96_07G213300 [Sorghum bicolor]|uniref:Uncharacterized protein n=2 Tax=Sorghum bicolor TaxID=4558 RepID=A0A921QLN0_SORBI|nr:hypothetical protein BDA96_07G213300 [Sorghum bicolor]KXG25583.1 hypothetical protein SORBI_3007G200700 [Sorghum bicolor]
MESCRSQLTSRRRLHLPVLVLTQVDPELACLEHPYRWCAECTFAHGLPPPALAVHNLMEQARFAHLFSVMSMHHRHTGYLFGSLVDFANESMGRELAFYWYRFGK